MTKKDIYEVILKILGIWVVKDTLLLLPEVLSVIIMSTNPGRSDDAFSVLGLTLLMLLLYVFVSYCLIFKSAIIIDKLKLVGAEENELIPINIHRSTILSISIFVIGGLLLSQEIPNFFRQLYSYWQSKRMSFVEVSPAIPYLILSGVKIVIALILLGNQREIVSFVELRRRK